MPARRNAGFLALAAILSAASASIAAEPPTPLGSPTSISIEAEPRQNSIN